MIKFYFSIYLIISTNIFYLIHYFVLIQDVEDTSHSEEENSDQVSYNDQPYYSHWQSQAAHHEEMPPLSERRPMSEQKSSSEPS